MNRLSFAAVTLALAAQSAQIQPEVTDTAALGRISDPGVVQQLLERFNVPGVSVAIIKDFKIAWTGAYGVADTDTRTPVTADTLFQAASISKPVAAMVSLKAVQDGRFSLDQNV